MLCKITFGARLLLGLAFFVFGLNGFLNFIPAPPLEPGPVQAFMGGLAQSGYFFPFLKATETICGLLLLTGFYVPLALIILSPIVVNIVLYHRLLAGGPPLDLFFGLLLIVAAYGYKDVFKHVLKAK